MKTADDLQGEGECVDTSFAKNIDAVEEMVDGFLSSH
jgi:hypothetical protein